MRLSEDAKKLLQDVSAEDVRREYTDLENQQYLKNMDVIREMEQLQYRYDVLDGEIHALELKKERIKPIILAHMAILCILGIIWCMYAASAVLFAVWALPFIGIATVLEVRKIWIDVWPYIQNMEMFRETMRLNHKETIDIGIEDRREEQKEIQERLFVLEEQRQRPSGIGEEQLS